MPTDWAEFRAQFPVAERYAYFDHAAVAPLPLAAVRALTTYGERLAAHGLGDIHHWVARVAEVRALAARLVGAPKPEQVAFVPNTTTAIGLIAEGFPFEAGDEVLLADQEYPSNQYPWLNLAHKGVVVRTVPSVSHRVPIDAIRAALTPRTRLVSSSFVQFATGFRQDLAALGQLCRERGAFFFVDAIQGLGAFPLDVRAMGIDACAADGHKWLLAPEGAGILYINPDWLGRLRVIGVGAHSMRDAFNYTQIKFDLKPDSTRYEGGAWNLPGITALGESLRLLLDAGIENVSARVLELTDYLCERAKSRGYEVASPRAGGERSGIVSMGKPGTEPDLIRTAARGAGVLVNVRGGRLRVSPHAYNTEGEIDRLFASADAL